MRANTAAARFEDIQERYHGQLDVPSDAAMERAALGDMLTDAEAAQGLAAMLTPKDFYSGKNNAAFEALSKKIAAGEPLDVVELTSRGVVTMQDYAALVGSTQSVLAWKRHGARLRELTQRRAFLQAARHLTAAAWNESGDNAATLSAAWAELTAASRLTTADDLSPEAALDDLEARMQRWKGAALATTGISDLDRAIGGGILPGQIMAVIGGEGSMKTSFALSCVESYLNAVGGNALYLSLDMPRESIALRRLLPLAQLSERELIAAWRRGEAVYSEAKQRREVLDAKRFGVIGGPLTLAQIDGVLTRHKAGLVVWDYITATAGFTSELDAQRACVEQLRAWQARFPDTSWVVLSQMSTAAKAGQAQGFFTGSASGGNNLARVCDCVLELFVDRVEPDPGALYTPPPPLIATVQKCRAGRAGTAWALDYDGPTMTLTGSASPVTREKKNKNLFVAVRL